MRLSREWFATPDGDDLALDHLAPAHRPVPATAPTGGGPPSAAPGTPRVLVLHGLEGSSRSVYVQGLLALARDVGFAGTALNFRSCAREPDDVDRWIPNRTARLYHSGETSDLDLVARELRRRDPVAPLFAIGISLGGNVLLKWLGEHSARSTPPSRSPCPTTSRPEPATSSPA